MAPSKRRSEARGRARVRAPDRDRRRARKGGSKDATSAKAASGTNRTKARGAKTPARADYPVAEIVARLHHHRHRATYGAVGALRGAPAVRVRGWFARRESPENSFVVSSATGEPLRYPPEKVHPALKEQAEVLETVDTLRAWLDAHPLPQG